MELIIVLAVLFWIFSSIQKNKQVQAEKAKNANQSKKPENHAPRAADATTPKVYAQRARMEKTTYAEGYGSTGRSAEGFSAYQTIAHRMEELQSAQNYQGSLGEGSSEGVDLCAPELQHARIRVASDSIDTDQIGDTPLINFTANGIMQGVVMSEILARPSQRKWRKR